MFNNWSNDSKRLWTAGWVGIALGYFLAINGVDAILAGVLGGTLTFLLKNTICVSLYPDPEDIPSSNNPQEEP